MAVIHVVTANGRRRCPWGNLEKAVLQMLTVHKVRFVRLSVCRVALLLRPCSCVRIPSDHVSSRTEKMLCSLGNIAIDDSGQKNSLERRLIEFLGAWVVEAQQLSYITSFLHCKLMATVAPSMSAFMHREMPCRSKAPTGLDFASISCDA